MAERRSAALEERKVRIVARRRFVLGALALGPASALSGCGDDNTSPASEGPSAADHGDSGTDGAVRNGSAPESCTVYPRQAEGPYYLNPAQLRADIREGKPGAELALTLQVVSAQGCAPLANVPVDVWHCDAAGIYSGFPGQLGGLNTTGQTFLRGTQVSDAEGRVRFATIYPGWYPGRTTHIHFKVRLSGSEAVSQLYFAEQVNSEVYASGVYAARGQKDTSNARDAIQRAAPPPLVNVSQAGGRYEASLRVVVA